MAGEYVYETDENWPFEWPTEEESREPLLCKCGGTTFEVFSPQFAMTVVRCTRCKAEGVVHDG